MSKKQVQVTVTRSITHSFVCDLSESDFNDLLAHDYEKETEVTARYANEMNIIDGKIMVESVSEVSADAN
ncbi:MAG: hypothetical protein H6937_07175 [Burkholderiales bacterium]|nr:hypothetical protein [Burkholderiales bacterium]